MDKQTCAALLNLLGFNSVDMDYNEWIMDYNEWITDFKTYKGYAVNLFLLKSITPNRVGSMLNGLYTETSFQSYDKMIAFARQIHEQNKR